MTHDDYAAELLVQISAWKSADGSVNPDAPFTIGFLTDESENNGLMAINTVKGNVLLPWYPMSAREASRVRIMLATMRDKGVVRLDNSIVPPEMVPTWKPKETQ